MNSRAFQFQLQAAEAAAAPVHAADEDETEPPIPMPLQLELVAQATADAPPTPGQGSGVAPAGVGKAEVVIKCPECPKSFTSEKAMFGHLRKHPERGYKGATRPATASAAAAAVAGDKQWRKKQVVWKEADVSVKNMTAAAATAGEKEAEQSNKWPVAAKRLHAAFAPSDEDEEAAMILLEMASSTHSTTSETQQESVQQVHAAPDAVSVHHQTHDVVQPMLVDHVAGHQNQITPEAEQIVQRPEIVLELSAESQTPPPPAIKELTTNLEITTEAVLIVVPANKKPIVPSPGAKKQASKKCPAAHQLDLEQIAAASHAPPDGKPVARGIPSPASNKKHMCPICGKTFPTYQALGGHMSSHSKGKTTGARHDELAVAQAAVQNILAHRYQQSAGSSVVTAAASTAGSGGGWVQDLQLQLQDVVPPAMTVAPVAQSAAAPASPHVCTECQMTFPSGQALGGHKRKHWFPEKQPAKAASAEMAAPPAAAEAVLAEIAAPAPVPASVARDFDLNELPEEGEGESNQP